MAQSIAAGYYWRGQLEGFFNWLKQPGMSVEEWQPESGLARAKRLLIAFPTGVLVWQ